jgi:hypothetical protein
MLIRQCSNGALLRLESLLLTNDLRLSVAAHRADTDASQKVARVQTMVPCSEIRILDKVRSLGAPLSTGTGLSNDEPLLIHDNREL